MLTIRCKLSKVDRSWFRTLRCLVIEGIRLCATPVGLFEKIIFSFNYRRDTKCPRYRGRSSGLCTLSRSEPFDSREHFDFGYVSIECPVKMEKNQISGWGARPTGRVGQWAGPAVGLCYVGPEWKQRR